MKKTLLFSFLLFGGVCYVSAQSKLDLMSRARLRTERLIQSGTIKDSTSVRRLRTMKVQAGVPENCTLGFVKLSAGASTDELTAEGAIVLNRRGDIAIVQMPTAGVERLSQLKSVRTMQLSRPVSLKMDKARTASGVTKAHDGLDLTQAYTGRGVIAGIVDGGMDPNHINFKNADGTSRVKYLGHLRLNNSHTQMLETRYTAETVGGFTTDDNTTFHGAHTMGIMAGSYRGDVTAATLDGNKVTIADIPCPYYGVATGADIAASCGTLMDAFIAQGVDDILD